MLHKVANNEAETVSSGCFSDQSERHLGAQVPALESSGLPPSVLKGDADWLLTRSENLDCFLLMLDRVRDDTIAEAGTAVLTRDGQDHSRCAPWETVRPEGVLSKALTWVMDVVCLGKEPFDRQQGKSGVSVPSAWTDDQVRPPRLFAALKTAFGNHAERCLG